MYAKIKTFYQQLLPQIGDEEWEALQGRLRLQQLKRGEFLVKRGDVCRQVSFVNKGLLRMFYLVDGKEVSMSFAAENEYISMYDSFLTRQPSSGNIDALEDCEVINLSYDNMQELYKEYPVFERFGRKIAEMLFILVASQTNRLLTLTPEERYVDLTEKRPEILQRVPQFMLASYIGITPEHLSRIRKKLSAR